MNRLLIVTAASALAAASGAALAQAQPQPSGAPQQAVSAGNADEVICEKQEVLGSRIATKRICMKRWEWAEKRLQERQDVEKAQTQVRVKGQ